MKEYTNEIIIAVIGIVTSSVAWLQGGKQRTKNETDSVLMKGADQIVDTSNKLLETLQTMLNEERIHRAKCENDIMELRNEINKIKSVCKADCFDEKN